jgi:anti-sigma regulatory factor (Ser/Thr protein kinase)
MSPLLRQHVATDFEALAVAQTAVRDFLAAGGVEPRCIEAIDVVLEELGGNVVRHARPIDHTMVLGVEVHSDRVLVTVEDTGAAFDPTAAPLEPPATSLAEARTGGRGLRLIRSITQALAHERIDDRNRVTASFRRT